MFETEDTMALTSRVLNDVPPRLSEVAEQPIPAEIDELVAACLEKDRDARPDGILDVKQVFDRVAVEHSWSQDEAKSAWVKWHQAPEASSQAQ